jgi:hypothetical protein
VWRAGSVKINDLIVPTADPRLPFGGRDASGYGVTRGADGLLEFTRIKTVSTRVGRFRPHYEQEHADDMALFMAYLRAAHDSVHIKGVGASGRRRCRPSLIACRWREKSIAA